MTIKWSKVEYNDEQHVLTSGEVTDEQHVLTSGEVTRLS